VALAFLIDYSFQILGAILIFIIGLFIARWVGRSVERFCRQQKLDEILVRFISSAARIIILVGVGIICLGKFGISVTPFVAAIGALSLGAGLALQGLLSNYGAGLAIMITRPFSVGDTLTLLGVSGVVSQVNLGVTILDTEDGEKITIPNKQIMGEVLVNSQANKVWEGTIGIAYSSDPQKAITVITEVLAQQTKVISEPAPQVGIQQFGDSAIIIGFRYWVPTREYYRLGFQINERIFSRFRAEHIEIPFPQREVRIHK
jgi:small conductance mechanosensitive channel